MATNHGVCWNRPLRLTITQLAAALALATSTASAQETENPFATSVDQRMGQRHFRAHCSLCHGYDATGGAETSGPDLTTGRFRHSSTVAGLFKVIRGGVDGTAMLGINADATDQTVWQIITYLDSLTPNPADVDLPGIASAGRQVFAGKGNCASCHMVNGEGGRRGPDLSRIGERRDPDELKTALVNPNDEVEPRWWTMMVTRVDGSVVEGLRMSEDTFTLRIIDEEEHLWSFSKEQLRAYDRITDSTMPSVEGTLTTGEVDDLISYLFSLRKES